MEGPHDDKKTTAVRRRLLFGFGLSLLVVLSLLATTVYANKGYPWPTEEEFKAEMLLVEVEYPGLLHTLLTSDGNRGDQRWAKIEEVFGLIDWDTWPWKDGAFYRQFNSPAWVEFFDSYELVPAVAVCVFGFAGYMFWRRAEEIKTQSEPQRSQLA